MKKMKILSLFLLLALAFSCQKVEDDLPKPKAEFNGDLMHTTYEGFTPLPPCEAHNIKVFIPECLEGTPWEKAVPDALNSYNATPTSLHFDIVSAEAQADIIFKCSTFGGNCDFPGVGEWPVSTGVGGEVELNTSELGPCLCGVGNIPTCYYQGVVMHELGHNLGLAHNEHEPDRPISLGDLTVSPSGAITAVNDIPGKIIHISGTPEPGTTDPNSIFNEFADCDFACAFNENDILALQSLYPPFEVTGVDRMCAGGTATFCYSGTDFPTDWSVTPNLTIVSNSGGCISVMANNSPGFGKVSICNYTQRIKVLGDDPCEIPAVGPIDFDEVCFDADPVCYDFSSIECLETLEITSSSPKLNVSVDGTVVCLTSIFRRTEDVTLTVTPVGLCTDEGEIQTWTIRVNSERTCPQISRK